MLQNCVGRFIDVGNCQIVIIKNDPVLRACKARLKYLFYSNMIIVVLKKVLKFTFFAQKKFIFQNCVGGFIEVGN